MPLTLNVGLSKKIGQPDYGSLGVSCHMQVELDATLLASNVDGFQDKVRQAYLACHQAVQEELQRQQAARFAQPGQDPNSTSAQHDGSNRNSGATQRPRLATHSQLRAIDAIARAQQVDLATLLVARYGVHQLADLSIKQASSLIDHLQAASNGNGRAR